MPKPEVFIRRPALGSSDNMDVENLMTLPFDNDLSSTGGSQPLEEGAVLLRGFAMAVANELVRDAEAVAHAASFRHLETRGGYTMSVAMTNCGRVGWVSDRTGYRYDPVDPDTGTAWPAL